MFYQAGKLCVGWRLYRPSMSEWFFHDTSQAGPCMLECVRQTRRVDMLQLSPLVNLQHSTWCFGPCGMCMLSALFQHHDELVQALSVLPVPGRSL